MSSRHDPNDEITIMVAPYSGTERMIQLIVPVGSNGARTILRFTRAEAERFVARILCIVQPPKDGLYE